MEKPIETYRAILIGMIEGMTPEMILKLREFIMANEEAFTHEFMRGDDSRPTKRAPDGAVRGEFWDEL